MPSLFTFIVWPDIRSRGFFHSRTHEINLAYLFQQKPYIFDSLPNWFIVIIYGLLILIFFTRFLINVEIIFFWYFHIFLCSVLFLLVFCLFCCNWQLELLIIKCELATDSSGVPTTQNPTPDPNPNSDLILSSRPNPQALPQMHAISWPLKQGSR